jgi:hypothetical protein
MIRRPFPPVRWGRRFACPAILVAAALLLALPGAFAQDVKPTDYQVKAVYLTKFGKFIEWPASAHAATDDKFNVCVLGPDPFGTALDNAVQGESIGRAALQARRISKVEEAAACRVLFVPSSEEAQIKSILAALGSSSVLTVSDAPDFVRRGGMIQFVIDSNRVHFEINLAATRRAGLTLSSDLLKLAVAIRRAP